MFDEDDDLDGQDEELGLFDDGVADEESDEDLEESDENADDKETEDQADDEDEDEETKIVKLAQRFGNDPMKLAKSVLHSQREIEKRTSEARANSLAADAVLAKLAEITQHVTPKQAQEDDTEYPAFPKDENGVPTPPPGYWSATYFPWLWEQYKIQLSDQYDDPDDLKVAARIAAEERYSEEKRKYESYRESKLSSLKSTKETAEDDLIKSNGEKQLEVVNIEKTRIAGIAGRMGLDPAKAGELALSIAQQMVQKAVKDGVITVIKATDPDTGKVAMRQAWDYVVDNIASFEKNLSPTRESRSEARQTPGAGGGKSSTGTIAQASSKTRYPERHVKFAASLGVSPEELAKTGILR